jgi:hypothetical protein
MKAVDTLAAFEAAFNGIADMDFAAADVGY